jgi:uncharacterized RDD family membrane protein YckC
MPSPNAIPTEFECASFGQRAFALLIDTALFFWLFAIPTKLPLPDGPLGFAILGVFILLASGYRIFGDAVFGGAAVGKRLVGIYVVDGATRQPCSFVQCLVRASAWVIPFSYFIEPIVLYSDGRQRYGDRMAGTYVLRRNPKAAPAPAPLRPVDFSAIRKSIQRSNDEQSSSR